MYIYVCCIYVYKLILLQHVSALFTPSLGSFTPRFITYENTLRYKSNSYHITVLLQLMSTIWFSQNVIKRVFLKVRYIKTIKQ